METIARAGNVSRDTYVREIVPNGKPVIITGDPALARAAATWSYEYLVSKHPQHRVPVEHYPTGDKHTACCYVEMEVARYIELIRSDPEARRKHYLAERPLDEILPNTASELELPAILAGEEGMSRAVFLGIDTFSAAHYHLAPTEALLTQVTGRKRVVLYSPEQLALLRPYAWYTARSNFSSLCGPGKAETSVEPACECTLEPGEMLFIPQGWSHVVYGEGETVSVTNYYPGSWRYARRTMAARDALTLGERRFVLFPLLKVAALTGLLPALIRLGALLGIVDKSEVDVWVERFAYKHGRRA